MLQQTQVATVVPYYKLFIKKFPNLKSLANSNLDEVLALWSGLGYYARARNLHKAARLVVDAHGGRFPKDIESVMELPGIGRSTAGAILAFSFGQHHSILDGNVRRVLARLISLNQWTGTRESEEKLWQWSDQLTPGRRVEDYTQAIMDLGATVCTRSKPACGECPISGMCTAFTTNKVASYPVAKPRKEKPVRSTSLLMILNNEGEVLLSQRPPTGIWGGLWSFPQVDEACENHDVKNWVRENLGLDIRLISKWPMFVHHFSHYDLKITPLPAKLLGANTAVMETEATVWYNPNHTRDRGLAQPVEKLLNELRNKSWHEQ